MEELFNLQTNTKFFIFVLLISIIYAIYYFVKNFETIEFQLKTIIVLVIMFLVFGIFKGIEADDNLVLLVNNFSLTTGKIEQYFVPNLKGGLTSKGISASTNYIKYSYSVNGIENENAYSPDYFLSVPDEKPDLKIEYLVIYEKNNPKNSIILLIYPINNNGDLEKYKKLFDTKIPDDVFLHNIEK